MKLTRFQFYVPIAWRLLRIITQQIHLLRRSISNLVTLHQLSIAPAMSSPTTPFGSSRPTLRSSFSQESNIGKVSSSPSPNQDLYAKQLENEGFRSQLASATQMRTILAFSAVATLSTVACFLALSSKSVQVSVGSHFIDIWPQPEVLGVVNPEIQTSANAQAINLLVPAYPYLIVRDETFRWEQ